MLVRQSPEQFSLLHSNMKIKISALLILFVCTLGVYSSSVRADEIDDLNEKIEERKNALEKIDKEIVEHQKAITQIGTEKKSLETEVKTLDLSKRKIETSIKKTEGSINVSELTIDKLGSEIQTTQNTVGKYQAVIRDTFREMQKTRNVTLIESVLVNQDISSVWDDLERLVVIRDTFEETRQELIKMKQELEAKKDLTESEKDRLESLQKQLAGEKEAVLATKQEKDSLLTQTKNKESEYQKLLQEKVAQKLAFEKELNDYESQLATKINRDNFPVEGSRILLWPLDNVRITQYFGTTEFAAKNPGRYGGRSHHNGIDLGTPVGTPVKSPLSGTIRATGNTDAIKGCYSWGKWVLVKHDNGLTSLFAHLSVVNGSVGDKVKTGDVIAYSGNTGNSTGPHLHFTLYASEGVEVVPYTKINPNTRCAGASTPTAPADAYLDPIDYLPSL